MRRLLILALIAAGPLYCSEAPLAATLPGGQAATTAGTIDGIVIDPSGASVAGASVELKNPVTNFSRETKTDSNGTFHISNVPPNQYHVQITASGFQTYASDVAVRTAVPLRVKAQLALASSSEEVTVEASGADLLETVPTVHTDADQSLIQKLPLGSSGQGLSDAITLTTPV